jgi:hypothetical protein
MLKHSILLLGSWFAFGAFGQVEYARTVAQQLCSPEFHGRGYVNGGDSLAANYIANEFKNIGCQFFKSGPFQSFGFPVNTFSGTMSATINGLSLKPGVDFVVSPDCPEAKNQTIALSLITAELIMNQKMIKNILSEKAMSSGSHKGGIGFAFHFSDFKGDTLKKAKELSKVLGDILPVVEIVDTKFTWSVADAQRKFSWIQVQYSAVDWTQSNLSLTVDVDAKVINHEARNVIAYAPAKKKSKKYFVFTAHYDHLGRMGQETYFPGGNDNASGIAMLLSLAKHYIENPENVNIVFIAFAGEEAGLIGSRYYTENPIFDMKKIEFLFNIDIMGSGEDGVTIVNATEFPVQFDALKSINDKQQLVTKVGSRGKAANSDHYFFTEKGVPAFFMYTMGPNKNYHDVYDTYEALSFNEFNDIFRLLVDFEKVVAWKR